MRDNRELKGIGKAAFKANYWSSVVASLLLYALTGGAAAAHSSNGQSATDTTTQGGQQIEDMISGLTSTQQLEIFGAIAATGLLITIVSVLIKIFLINPLQVGCYRFFRNNVASTGATLNDLKEGFGDYGRVFLTLFLRDLFTFLWALLLFIPGIVKSYSYRLVPYLLKDHPELSPTEAITRSRQMMDGHKWQAFVFDLSFIGWYLLGFLTLGAVNVFWSNPYHDNAAAAFYLDLEYPSAAY